MKPDQRSKQWWIDRCEDKEKECNHFQESLEKVNKVLMITRDEIERLRGLKKKPKK